MQTIDVAMVSWPNHPKRIEYCRATLEAIRDKLSASEHNLRVYCSIESERDSKSTWHGDELEALLKEHGVTYQYRKAPANLGANMNAAIRMCSGDFIFLDQDDWCLCEPLDLSPGANLLEQYPEIDLIRYSWPLAPYMLPTFLPGPDGWRLIDPKGKWPYGDDPHLRRRDFMGKWGWYFEGGGHGSASGDMMDKLAQGNAVIAAADKVYYGHKGYVTAVVNDKRPGGKRRQEVQ